MNAMVKDGKILPFPSIATKLHLLNTIFFDEQFYSTLISYLQYGYAQKNDTVCKNYLKNFSTSASLFLASHLERPLILATTHSPSFSLHNWKNFFSLAFNCENDDSCLKGHYQLIR